jgi:hypothetical protein
MDHHSLFFRYAVVTGIVFHVVSVNMLFYMQGNQTSFDFQDLSSFLNPTKFMSTLSFCISLSLSLLSAA